MQSVKKTASASTLVAATLFAAVACDRPLEPTTRLRPTGPSFATVVAAGDPKPTYEAVLAGTENGRPVYLLDQVCDIFIGEPVIEPPEDPTAPAFEWYDHQRIVNVPEGSIVRLTGASKTFVCDATDPDNPTQPVIEPSTQHAAKGDGPKVTTKGVTLDLNGYSITVSPAFGTPVFDATGAPVLAADGTQLTFENIGVVLMGEDNTLTNSSTTEVSKIFGFGHNVDIEAVRPTVQGKRWDADGDPLTVGWVYNIESDGGFGIRLSEGPAVIDQVKSVGLGPEGQGFEARRMVSGKLTVTNSHFEGTLEGAFLREITTGVEFTGNYVNGRSGNGIATRQVTSNTATPIVISNNEVAVTNGEYGILWGRDSRSNNSSLVISGNTITGPGVCGFAVSRRNTTTAPYSLLNGAYPKIATDNTISGFTRTTCRLND